MNHITAQDITALVIACTGLVSAIGGIIVAVRANNKSNLVKNKLNGEVIPTVNHVTDKTGMEVPAIPPTEP
jgi:hypothetical protein